jgi:TolA-binding protein
MPLGNTAKKLQQVANMAEDVYGRLAELREQVSATRETVEETSRRIDRLESEAAEQRALLEAIAEDRGIDLDAVPAEAHIGEAEPESESTEAAGEGTGATDAGRADGEAGSGASAGGTGATDDAPGTGDADET